MLKIIINIVAILRCTIIIIADVPLHTREKLRQTYEFALDHVGIDYHSTSIWSEYIAFLKNE